MPVERLARAAPTGLRRRLVFLVLASVLPFMLLVALVARKQLTDQKPVAGDHASARARRIADDLDARLRDIKSTAEAITYAISADPSARASNDRTLRAVSRNISHEELAWRVLTPKGLVIGSSTADLDAAERDFLRGLAIDHGERRGDFFSDPLHIPSAGHVVFLVVPMRDARQNPALLFTRIKVNIFQPALIAPDLPRGTSIAVITEGGSIVGRSPDPDRWVGFSIAGTPLDSAATAALKAPVEFTTLDSVPRLLSVTRMSAAPWRVSVGIPTNVLLIQAQRDFRRTLGYGGLALALALALALWQASRIVEPIRRLSLDAARLGTGDLAHRSGVKGTDELAVLATAMNEMATTLEQQGAGLRESEERYRGLFDINPLPMWVLDPKSLAFLAVNRAAIEAYGYSEQEFLNMKSSEIRLPEDVPDLLRHMEANKIHARRYLTRHRRRDGTVFPVEIDAGAITFGGQPARLVVANDISERVRAEESLRDAEVQLRQSQRLEAIGQLTGGIAHDFNNVLTAIGSYSDFLYDSLDAGDARRLDILEIRKASDRAAGLTKQLLAFSRSQILQPRVLDVNVAVTELDMLLKRLLTADIELILALDPEIGHVRADPGQLAQVIMNLVVNARDAMPKGGVLTVSSRNDHVTGHPGNNAGATAPKPGDYVVVEVADTGIGMDDETVQRIFEPFFTTKGPGQGTGLGLSTVHGIVHQSGGYIAVDSKPGAGTTFMIRLPRVYQPVDGEPSKPARAVAGQRTEVILVVEDEEAVRRAARRILVKKGYTVVEAVDGNDALDMMDTHARIDLLLTDLVMPGMGGRELVRALDAQGRSVPTLYMSGYTKDAVMRAELDPDIPVLEKPFSQDELAAKVREVLDKNGG